MRFASRSPVSAYPFALWLTFLASLAHADILVLGDSLSAAYGLPARAGWVALLEDRLAQEKFGLKVINASVSGETSAGGASRLEALLVRHRPRIVILALGANDGLRGLPTRELKQNLERMIRTAQRHGARVVLLGMRLPPNYGPAYTRDFAAVYAELARAHRLAFVPFMLEGFADRPEFFLADGLHPNATAQARILDNVWPALHASLRAR